MAYSKNTDNGIIVPKKWYEKLPRAVWSEYEKIEQSDDWKQYTLYMNQASSKR